jgi:hypothetical protein
MSSDDEDATRRVVMSKMVTRRYLEEIGSLARSITVFYGQDQVLRDLLSYLDHLDLSYDNGFDSVTFIAETDLEVREIERACERLGLAYDAV